MATTQNSDSTALLCLDVRQHIIGFLGVDVEQYLFRLEVESTSAATSVLERGPKKTSRGGSFKAKAPTKHRTEPEKLFPWISSLEINQTRAVQDYTTIQLLNSSWYEAFHTTVLEADHIIVYRALQMRTRVSRFREDAAEYVNHVQYHESSATQVVLHNNYAASWVPAKKTASTVSRKIDSGKVKKSSAGECNSIAMVSRPPELRKSLLPDTVTRQLDQLPDVCRDLADLAQRLQDKRTELEESDAALIVAAAADEFNRKAQKAVLGNLSRAALTELASFVNPPANVIEVLRPIGQLVQPDKPADWYNLKIMLRSFDLIPKMEQAATTALSNAAGRKRLEKIAVHYGAPFAPVHHIRATSLTAGHMYQWFLDLISTCNNLIVQHPQDLEDDVQAAQQDANNGLTIKQMEKAKEQRLAEKSKVEKYKLAGYAAMVVFQTEVRNLLHSGFGHGDALVDSCLVAAESAIRASIAAESQYEIHHQLTLLMNGGADKIRPASASAAGTPNVAAPVVVDRATSSVALDKERNSKTKGTKEVRSKSVGKPAKIAAETPTTGQAVVHRHYARQPSKKK